MTTEAVARQSAYDTEPFHGQRTARLPDKLARLGVLGLDRDQHVLDVCCRRGEALEVLQRHGFRHLAGIDSRDHRAWASLPGIRFATADVRHMPFADGEFDAIISIHALHRLGDSVGVAAFLAECRRVLRPGGHLFIRDIPGGWPITLRCWALRRRLGTLTPGLRNLAAIVEEEWASLATYLRAWPVTETLLLEGPFQVARWRRGLFHHDLTLTRPENG